jgi:hypothetical protein
VEVAISAILLVAMAIRINQETFYEERYFDWDYY